MGSEISAYTLCEISNLEVSNLEVPNLKSTQFVICKAVRPSFSNLNQRSEDDAYDVLEKCKKTLMTNFCKAYNFSNYREIATFDGFPEGDIFYEAAAYLEVDVWIAMYKDNKPYFSFGIAGSEDEFWQILKDGYDDDDCSNYYSDLVRPAIKETSIFIQS